MANIKYTIAKGTHDILPQDSYRWRYVESVAREVASLFGCLEIRTPTFEHTELFLRSIGDATDVVSKEMYSFVDKSTPPTSLTLKPEGTAGVARSFVENALDSLGLPLKMYYITPVYRYEKPQKGRYRQHHQFGVEFYGSTSPYMDYDVIMLAHMFLTRVGITDTVLNINNIGCSECRGAYINALQEFFRHNKDGFCDTCKDRIDKNPLRVLDCKVRSCIDILRSAPNIADYICEGCKEHSTTLHRLLDKHGIQYIVNSKLVRGLDYYNRTVFEFVTNSDALGSQSTVCGGGRYDSLVESIGGKPTACAGFGLGLERLLSIMQGKAVTIDKPCVDIFVMYASGNEMDYAVDIATTLRADSISVEVDYTGKSLKAQFKHADRVGARYAMVIGAREIETGRAILRNLSSKQEIGVEIARVADALRI